MAFDGRLLAGISVLAAVIESGSFARAADAMGLSASGVSRAIGRLEARVGVRLLDRTTRAMRLTDDGARFYQQVRPLLDGIEEAAVAAAKAALGMAEWRLSQRRVTAPAAGRIADVLARPGETMAAGAPVVSLLPPGNIFVRFFVPETDLATIHLGDRVAILCDSCPADLAANVSFIAPQVEYTPPVIYSEESRAKLVIMIEARPPVERASVLNPGQPVTVRPIARRGAS